MDYEFELCGEWGRRWGRARRTGWGAPHDGIGPMFESVAPHLGTAAAVIAALAAGAVGLVAGRQGRRVVVHEVAVDPVSHERTLEHDHVHEWGVHQAGEVHWHCTYPGCTAVGPRITGAQRPETEE